MQPQHKATSQDPSYDILTSSQAIVSSTLQHDEMVLFYDLREWEVGRTSSSSDTSCSVRFEASHLDSRYLNQYSTDSSETFIVYKHSGLLREVATVTRVNVVATRYFPNFLNLSKKKNLDLPEPRQTTLIRVGRCKKDGTSGNRTQDLQYFPYDNSEEIPKVALAKPTSYLSRG